MIFKDKNIIVTGAGAGIGRALTLQLVEKGARVAALDINEASLKETKNLSSNKNLVEPFVVNIASDKDLDNFKEEFYNKFENLDILINNAGIVQPFVNVDKLDYETIYRVMDVNFYGPLKLIKEFLPEFIKRDQGHIVNISSMGGFFPFPGQSIYGASKAAVKLLTEGLYAELIDTNVAITLVFPGAIGTDILKNSDVEISSVAGGSQMKLLSPEKAAEMILDGIAKKKFKLYVGNDSKFMNLIYKFNDKAAIKFIQKKMK